MTNVNRIVRLKSDRRLSDAFAFGRYVTSSSNELAMKRCNIASGRSGQWTNLFCRKFARCSSFCIGGVGELTFLSRMDDPDVEVFRECDVFDCIVSEVDNHRVASAAEHDAQLIKKSAWHPDGTQFGALTEQSEVHRRS